jgi:hypothetical protein
MKRRYLCSVFVCTRKQIKRLPKVRGKASALPGTVRKYKIQKATLFPPFLCFK